MTYSPAPWRVSHDENNAMPFNGEEPTAVLDANGMSVACNTTYYPTSLKQRDAYIIAAAPDLLVALQKVAAIIKDAGEEDGYPEVFAAINKALGQ